MAQRWYRACVYQSPGDGADVGWDIVFPQFPGCVSQGDTVLDAIKNGKEALALHIEAMVSDGRALPDEAGANDPDPGWLIEIPKKDPVIHPFLEMEVPGRSTRINITMDEALVERLDRAVRTEGTTRSGYLAQAVREKLQRARELP